MAEETKDEVKFVAGTQYNPQQTQEQIEDKIVHDIGDIVPKAKYPLPNTFFAWFVLLFMFIMFMIGIIGIGSLFV